MDVLWSICVGNVLGEVIVEALFSVRRVKESGTSGKGRSCAPSEFFFKFCLPEACDNPYSLMTFSTSVVI